MVSQGKVLDPKKQAELREKSIDDFWVFAKDVCMNSGLDSAFHGLLCRFVEHGETTELPMGDYYWPTREALEDSKGTVCEKYRIGDGKMQLKKRMLTDPTNMDGTWRGFYLRIRDDAQFKLVLVPRGHLKTTLLTVYQELWHLVRDPTHRILLLMNTAGNAKSVLSDMKSHFERNDRFRETFPELILSKKERTAQGLRWQAGLFDLPQPVEFEGMFLGRREAQVTATGVETKLTSTHFTRRHYDDLCDLENTATAEGVQKTIKKFAAAESLGIGAITRDFYVGTPWDYGDVSQYLLDPRLCGKRNINVAIATAIDGDGMCMFPADRTIKTHPGFTKRKIRETRKNQGRLGLFSSQYLMQPVDRSNQSFRSSWWKWYDPTPGSDGHPIGLPKCRLNTVITLDPAISQRKSGDYSAFVVTSHDPFGNWYVREIWRYQGLQAPQMLDTIFELNEKWQPMAFGIEAISFQKMLGQVIIHESYHRRKQMPPIVEVTKAEEKSKEFRIKRIAPKVRQGMVWLPAGDPTAPMDSNYQRGTVGEGVSTLISEGERFPKVPHDDVLDALSMTMDVMREPSHPRPAKGPVSEMDDFEEWAGIGKSDEDIVDPYLGSEW
jgi:phage terminase large subunit-like protein